MGSCVPDGCRSHAVSTRTGAAGNQRQRRPVDDRAFRAPARCRRARRRCAGRRAGAHHGPDAIAHAARPGYYSAGSDPDTAPNNPYTTASDHAGSTAANHHNNGASCNGTPRQHLKFAAPRSAHGYRHECAAATDGRAGTESTAVTFADAKPIADEYAHAMSGVLSSGLRVAPGQASGLKRACALIPCRSGGNPLVDRRPTPVHL